MWLAVFRCHGNGHLSGWSVHALRHGSRRGGRVEGTSLKVLQVGKPREQRLECVKWRCTCPGGHKDLGEGERRDLWG